MNNSDEANFNGFSSAIRNRLAILELTLDEETFLKNYGNKFHYYVSSFLKNNPSLITEPESTEIEGFATPRSWEFLSNTIKDMDKNFIEENCKMIAEQYTSKATAQALSIHISFINQINFDEIINKKEIINVSKLDTKKQIVFFYIINEVKTISDGVFIIDLINKNYNNSNFIGFMFGEIGIRYNDGGDNISDGLKYIVDVVTGSGIAEKDYSKKFSKTEKALIEKTELINKDDIINIAIKYLL